MVGRYEIIGINQSYARSMAPLVVCPIVDNTKSGLVLLWKVSLKPNMSLIENSRSADSLGGFRAPPFGLNSMIDFCAARSNFFRLFASDSRKRRKVEFREQS